MLLKLQLIAFVALVFVLCIVKRKAAQKRIRSYEPVTPEPHLKWEETPPRNYRPFKKGAYHLTMGLQKSNYQEWILMEDTYKSSTEYRAKITGQHWDNVNLIAQPETSSTRAAVVELYERVFAYMSTKYPQYFQPDGEDHIINLVHNVRLPRLAGNNPTKQLLAWISCNVEEDFILLEYDPKQGEYVMKAGNLIFCAGFSPQRVINSKLTDIHAPVPQYKEKLQTSMNRYFKRVEYPNLVQRVNWSMQVGSTELYTPQGHHGALGEKFDVLESVDPDNTYTRVERQVLGRLPDSGMLVFTIRTYLTSIARLKDEGYSDTLISAIEGLPEEAARYKRAPEWSRAVINYLSEGLSEKI